MITARLTGDGAAWLWNIAQELLPDAVEIVECFHVKQQLSNLATALHPDRTVPAMPWAQHWCEELDEGKLTAHPGSLRLHGLSKHCP